MNRAPCTLLNSLAVIREMAKTRRKKVAIGCLAVFLLVAGFGYWFYGPLLRHFLPTILGEITDRKKEYIGTSSDNLKIMRNALLSYEESEGQFPDAKSWMTAIEKRIVTDELKRGEAEKKLVTPENVGQPDKFGYALNDAVSGKYHEDIKDPKTPLVFESVSDEKNAHGDPAKTRKPGGLAIAVDGTILPAATK